MNKKMNVCLINDSFAPIIDGIATTVNNYAVEINEKYGQATVVTPYYPNADDSAFNYPVYRYPSLNTMPLVGYRAGIPFASETISDLRSKNFDLIHSHCPATASMLARVLRDDIDKPLVFTYHTKYDIDIQNSIKGHLLQEELIKLLVDNVSASDEVWTVSDGAGKNLQSLGYEGDYIVMHNGVDFPKGRVDDSLTEAVTGGYELPKNVPVYLFVGRMIWYKGMRTTLDALAKYKASGADFRMVFIGWGADKDDIKKYTEALKLSDKVIFGDPIADRLTLRAWYCRANLFLFPSVFDTNGLVVREAAACGLASVLVKGSCAAEDTKDRENCLWMENNAESMYQLLKTYGSDFVFMKKLGQNAQEQLYISWEDSIACAYDRYQTVADNYKKGIRNKRHTLSDDFYKASDDMIRRMIEAESLAGKLRMKTQEDIEEFQDELKNQSEYIRGNLESSILNLRSGVHKDISGLKSEVKKDIDILRDDIKEDIDDILNRFDRYK